MDPGTHAVDIIELANKATELVEDGMGCAQGEIVVQQIMIGEVKYNLSVVITAINE